MRHQSRKVAQRSEKMSCASRGGRKKCARKQSQSNGRQSGGTKIKQGETEIYLLPTAIEWRR